MDLNRPYAVFRGELLMSRHLTLKGALKVATTLGDHVKVYRNTQLVWGKGL